MAQGGYRLNKSELNKILHPRLAEYRFEQAPTPDKIEITDTQQSDIDRAIEQQEQDYISVRIAAEQLSPEQHFAIDTIRNKQYCCVIGQAGTGKTTTVFGHAISAIEKYFTNVGLHPEIFIVSYTGRAVQQSKRSTPAHLHFHCMTIHKFLGYHPEFVEYQDEETKDWKMKRLFVPEYTMNNKRPATLVLVDESSMVPVYLWNNLIAALSKTCKIALIGDINQLRPVNGHSVLGYALSRWPTAQLTQIFRQAAENPIIANADRILHGEMPKLDKRRFAMVELSNDPGTAQSKVLSIVKQLADNGKFNPLRDAFIVAQNDGMFGQRMLNDYLVEHFNGEAQRIVINAGMFQKVFAVGDKVMNLRNDNERGLTNGMCGIVTSIERNAGYEELKRPLAQGHEVSELDTINVDDLHELTIEEDSKDSVVEDEGITQRQASHILWVKFEDLDDDIPFNTAGQISNLTLAYAFTCHKSQGGQHPLAIVLCYTSGNENRFATPREWLYTAVTRAQERVLLLYNQRGLINTLRRQAIKGENLREKMRFFTELENVENTLVPELPVST